MRKQDLTEVLWRYWTIDPSRFVETKNTKRVDILNVTSILGWSVHGLVLPPTCWPARFSCVTAIGCRQRCLVSAGGCARNRRRSSGFETRQRDVDERGQGEGPRLRPGEGLRHQRRIRVGRTHPRWRAWRPRKECSMRT